MGYKYILCDADETLLDFSAAEKQAFKESCAAFDAVFDDDIYEIYHQINDSHWKQLELGLTTREKLKVERFEQLFIETGILPKELAKDFSTTYLSNISHQGQLLPNVVEALEVLSKTYDIYIITNGTAEAQHGRLDDSPVMSYVKELFISEEIGAAKPSRDFFNHVIESIGDRDLSSYLVVGDSPSSDIKGAVDFGIDSCFVTNGKEYKDHGQTYTIKSFSDITSII
ncbi:MAG: noncanonical pyrimidine nucleotidase, YjjG family [Ruminococcaceae bacterium]|nr:noncanonical pyrimidine nucleotidase, YjjG family [Oscillospiraceae bacterium]